MIARALIQPQSPTASGHEPEMKVFTVVSGGAVYGLPIASVQTIFRIDRITPVPLAPSEIVGLINLRGKINTAASLRLILGLEDEGNYTDALAICIERRAERFALIVDDIGDVVVVSDADRVSEPPNLDPKRAALTSAVYWLKNEILPMLDIDALLEFAKGPVWSSAHRLEGVRQ